VADADSHITEGEMAVLRAAIEDWGIGTEVLGKSVAGASPLNA
jgi:hypothetical protein